MKLYTYERENRVELDCTAVIDQINAKEAK